jgi:hypothetical protein
MLPPLIQRPGRSTPHRKPERGVTMALVAVSLVAIISFAALSIDLGTLYEARAEAQRAADLAALAAARMISISGITGDPGNAASSWQPICGGTDSAASVAAISVAQQNLINGSPAPLADIKVYYGTSGGVGTNTDCTAVVNATAFAVNPVVQVRVQQPKLPTFFAHIFSLVTPGGTTNSGVSATATAEVFNPSGSGAQSAANMIPVEPRCVKPWIIPNVDPGHASTAFVSNSTGAIGNGGIYNTNNGVIGETFTINADCMGGAADCEGPAPGNLLKNPPQYTGVYLQYVPALVSGVATAVPSCSASTGYQAAIAGCDQRTVYTCGTPSTATGATQVDLTENPLNPAGTGGDSPTAAICLIHQQTGFDVLNTGSAKTPVYPFQIMAGLGNPLVQTGIVNNNDIISSSPSIVTIPIYDGMPLGAVNQPAVTIVGFLQVFINVVNFDGSMNVTVMNVSGCSNNAAGNPTVTGTSPVPIRLITSP